MDIQRIEAGDRLSRATIHNGMVYLCGVVFTGTSDIRKQTEGCLSEIDRLLALAGTSRSRALHIMVHVKDIEHDHAVNEVYDGWIDSSSPPSRTCVVAAPRRPEALVEITAVAAL